MLRYSFLIITVAYLTRTLQSMPVHNSGDENSAEDPDYDVDYSSEKIIANDAHGNSEMLKFEDHLNNFLEWYYEKYINIKNESGNSTRGKDVDNIDRPHDYDQMQSDQPEGNLLYSGVFDGPQTYQEKGPLNSLYENLSGIVNITRYSEENSNFTDNEYLRVMRNRTKDIWIQMLKDNILRKIGRVNGSLPSIGNEIEIQTFNISQFLPVPNNDTAFIDDESIGEKIRSYYPSCNLPRNTDQDVWKDENAMNLYFNVDQSPEENGVSIATATLRLYRLPQQNVTLNGVTDSSCENTSGVEDDKLLRISIYWYTRSLKKHRVKRRLSDSKVIGESAQWVELSVRPATRAWTKGRNLGLAVVVEDQEGALLKADKYFKGASCTVGASTPKPIPTVIVDAARRAELERSNSANGTNSTTALHNYISLLPKIDICTLEFPQNYSLSSISLSNLRINKCNLAKIHTQTQKLLERERIEKLATLAGYSPPHRHIRHQRQHLQDVNDPRSRIIGQKIILTNQELLEYNAQLANKNLTTINR